MAYGGIGDFAGVFGYAHPGRTFLVLGAAGGLFAFEGFAEFFALVTF